MIDATRRKVLDGLNKRYIYGRVVSGTGEGVVSSYGVNFIVSAHNKNADEICQPPQLIYVFLSTAAVAYDCLLY